MKLVEAAQPPQYNVVALLGLFDMVRILVVKMFHAHHTFHVLRRLLFISLFIFGTIGKEALERRQYSDLCLGQPDRHLRLLNSRTRVVAAFTLA